MRIRSTRSSRMGSLSPLAALLGTFLLGLVAFGIDVGYIVVVQTDLQNASDAAALAGADALMNGYVEYSLPNLSDTQKQTILNKAKADARARAKQYASYNGAGDAESLTLRDEDIEFGYVDTNGSYSVLSSMSEKFPNSIKVILRRDDNANEPIDLFFAPVLGTDNSNLAAIASATIQVGTLETVKKASGKLHVLPVTYDVAHWDNFVATGQDPDGNTSVADSNGLPQLQVYPSIKYKGNFGQLSLNGFHVGASTTIGWIHDGMQQDDIASLQTFGHLPLSKRDKTQWDWIGNTGMKSSMIMAINEYVGDTFLIPLYIAKNAGADGVGYEAGVGQGKDYYYNIERFVGVRIMQPDKTNKEVVVQPASILVDDEVLLAGAIKPAGEESTFSMIFTSPRMTH